ncbi:MAG: HAMP domain-containing sensor histidine kinase [Nitrospiraceae bacterium]|nr:HAMP domain-containing sensor histidine kinase [Nitrospiraceae bacterium]
MTNSQKYSLAAIVLSALFITYLHYTTIESIHSLHDIYRQLYYIPLLIGALVFGLRGAILSYLFVSLLYLPYMAGTWTGGIMFETKRMLFLVFSGIFSYLAGYLIDRDSRRKKEIEKERYLAGLGQVSSAIVHDLKNPIITIEGFARRLQQGKGNVDTAAQAIMDSAKVMKNIVHDVLDFAKPIQLELKEEDAAHVIKKACELCTAKADEKEVKLSLDIPDVPQIMRLDSPHMQRALVNLISNAIEASEKGQNVSVSVDPKEDSLSITVRDAGAGMDKETRESLFIPFFTKKSTGTGLGMPIAKKIIEGHKGEIRVKSQPAKGTEVIVSLPAK